MPSAQRFLKINTSQSGSHKLLSSMCSSIFKMNFMLAYFILSERFSLSYIQLWDHVSFIFSNMRQFVWYLATVRKKLYVKIQVDVKHY